MSFAEHCCSRSQPPARSYLALLFSLTAINYLDRQSLSVVAPLLQRQFSISAIGYSRIVFLFLLGYTIGQVMDGKLIDKVGSSLGIILCVGVWSTVSILHALGAGIISFAVLRFLLGVSEAGNWPGGVKVVAEHFPLRERAFAVGIFNSGSTAGAVIAPPIVAAIATIWGWRPMFAVTGATGFIWILLWVRLHRSNISSPETALLQPPKGPPLPLRTLLKSRSVWGLMGSRFLADPIWWFYAFWLPEYLTQRRGFSMTQIGRIAWIPFAFAGVGGCLGGWASDLLVRRGCAPVAARKFVMVAAGALMVCGALTVYVRSSTLALALISVVVFAFTGWQSNLYSLAADLFPGELVASVIGLSGTAAAIGGMLFTLATGWLIQHVSYNSVFLVSSVMSICAVLVILWLIRGSTSTLSEIPEPAAAIRRPSTDHGISPAQ